MQVIRRGIDMKNKNREELNKIREAIESLEGGKPPEVIDVESE